MDRNSHATDRIHPSGGGNNTCSENRKVNPLLRETGFSDLDLYAWTDGRILDIFPKIMLDLWFNTRVSDF
jgi:hypothetical protein